MSASTRALGTVAAGLVGIVVGSQARAHPGFWHWLAIVVLVFLSWRWSKIRLCVLLLLGFLVGLLYVSLWRISHFRVFNGEDKVVGVITGPPDIRSDKVIYTVAVSSPLARDSFGKPGVGQVLVFGPRYPVFAYGDELSVAGTIEAPESFAGFDYPLFLERFQVYGMVSRVKSIKALRSNQGNMLFATLYQLRVRIEHTVQNALPEPESSFLDGVLLGNKRSIPSDIQQALVNTGTVHIIVTSGSNITILVELLERFFPVYTMRRRFLAVLGTALFFCFLTGAPASVLRGASVACLSAFLKLYSRRAWPIPFVLVAALLLLLGNPLMLVADPGFQVSFAAFAGLACLGEPLQQFLERFRWFKALPEVLSSSLVASIAATLGIAGVSLKLFGQLSFLGLIVNPLALWLLLPLTFLGLLLAVIGWLTPFQLLLLIPIWLLLRIEIATIQFFGNLPVGIVHLQISWPMAFGMYGVIGFCFYILKKGKKNACPIY